MTLLFDLAPLSEHATDCGLEAIHKAIAEEPHSGLLWTPHHNQFLRRHVEDVTDRGISILAQIHEAMSGWLAGTVPGPLHKSLLLKDFTWARYAEDDLQAIRDALEAKNPLDYTLEDWMDVVDLIIHRYLPDKVIKTEAEYLAVRSVILGKVERDMSNRKLLDAAAEALVSALPVTLAESQDIMTLTPLELSSVKFARARAGEFIADIGERTRHKIKQLIIHHEENHGTIQALQSELLDQFGVLNRDWRRIAITEVARNANEGFIAGMKPGAKVTRTEAYVGACPFCRKINGRTLTVVSPGKADKNGETEVWPGKTNVGRSSSPRKRVGDMLVERDKSELWQIPAGVVHPNCRGGWIPGPKEIPNVDPKFIKWMDEVLAKA